MIVQRKSAPIDDFFNEVSKLVQRSSRKDAFVFVHGFNVTFNDAILRTAQIAYDLGFDGTPILYSWPSVGSVGLIGYATDSNNADWTVAHLQEFLEAVATRTGATRIHLIAHSMGNKALVNALNRMSSAHVIKFGQIALTAPDMDADTFAQMARAVRNSAEHVTLYASSNDRALVASKELQTYPRAGDTAGGPVVVPGIDTVDVSAVDTDFIGHFYYGSNDSVLSDLFLVITQGLTPDKRPRLRPAGVLPKRFWRFIP